MKIDARLDADVSSFLFCDDDFRPMDLLWFYGYRAYLEYFESLDFDPASSLRETGGLAMTWTWMGPARLRDTSEKYPEAAVAINEIRQDDFTAQRLEAVAAWTGDSMVAASKLLHFTFPDRCAVWDSRVARALYSVPKHNGKLRRAAESYLTYLKDIPKLRPSAASRKVLERYTGQISDMRFAELTLFMMDRRGDGDRNRIAKERKAAKASKLKAE